MAFVDVGTEHYSPSLAAREPLLLHELFEAQVARRPARTAVEALGESLSYEELDHLANQIAHWLRGRGVGPGSLVGLYQTKSCQLFASLLGILKAGAGYVPVDAKFPKDRIEGIFEDAGVRAVITEAAFARNLCLPAKIGILAVDRDAGIIAEQSREPVAGLDTSPEGVCYVIYTSGSTGRPKGVMIAHRNAIAFVKTLKTVYKVMPQDRIYQGFSVAFDASVEEIWAAFSLGATLVVAPEDVSRSPLDVAAFLTANQITYFSTVPTFLSLIDGDLPTVRLLVLGGEACMPELVVRWASPERRLLNTYGPTEATVVATWAECRPGEAVTIGRALPGYQAYVLDGNLEPVGPGAEGELFIGGAGVALGYLNRPELTAECFIDNPFSFANPGDRLYRTHDLVRLTHEGTLQFLGRIDGQVKIRGFRVELSEIESVLIEYPSVRAAAVRVVDGGGLPELAAYVVVDPNVGTLDRLGVAEMLRCRLPEYMLPKYLDILECLPALTSGKVDRKQLPEPVSLLKGIDREYVAPATDMERVTADAWEKCFRTSPISVEDDFFLDLGGHSLLAAQVITELRAKLDTSRLCVRDIYKHRTVRALAARLQEMDLRAGVAPAAQTDAAKAPSAGEAAFASVPAWERWLCVALQGISVAFIYGLVAAPVAYAVLMTTAVMSDSIDLGTALWISTGVGFSYWPALLLLSIAVKWLVIGRYRPGRYPVWSLYYFRWWFVNRFQALSWSHMFVGTPLMSLYYRAMGAKVGSDVTICTPICSAFDMVSIGDRSSIGAETHITGYHVEAGMLLVGEIEIGRDCFIGMHCSLGVNTRMGDWARLDDMSVLGDGARMAAGESRRGSPTMPAEVAVPAIDMRRARARRPVLYGAIHLGLIYLMGYFLILSGAPAVILIAAALVKGGPLWGIAAAFAAMPLSVLWYALLLVTVKRIFIGRIEPGLYPVESTAYLRHWFLDYLLNNTRSLLMPVYATVYFPSLLRALGAKIGSDTEISTVTHITPDLLEIGSGSFLADACLVGGYRIHHGFLELRHNRIGDKTFIGNSALLPGGSDIGNDALLGVLSTPAPEQALPDGQRWLGAPAFPLPQTQNDLSFSDAQTYTPSPAARRQRAVSDAVRVLLPGFISTASLAAFVAALYVASLYWPVWIVAAGVPLLATVLAFASMAAVAGIKQLLMGTFQPTVQPLWCRYVWNNEIVNGTYESVAETILPHLLGTPFAPMCMRMMGCKIGKWVFLETTFFSEFDLVTIGDRAALNQGSTIQTHLFEDRVMKADYLTIGAGCTLGNMAVVLYSTEMKSGACLGPLSLLMKGEMLPAGSRWCGIPSEPMQMTAAAEPARRSRTLMKLRFRMAGDAVRSWATQYMLTLQSLAKPSAAASTEPEMIGAIHSPAFREEWGEHCRRLRGK
ncbi:MAG: amino acid adenylation domain-containing protein [Hyphomicrobiaceae bacterium]|nr:MAG: amino acid adenylation domain-containing protein [Hyphomicrobiaceae bacterium]